MANFLSNLLSKRTKHRGIYSGQEYTIEGVVKIKSGTVLTTADIFKFAPLGENQVVKEVWAYTLGAAGATQVSIGYAQRLDAAGQPEVVERNGPRGSSASKFTSPASDTTAFAGAAVLTTARRVVDTSVVKLTGPVDLAAFVTTGATLAADIEIHVGAVIVGELSNKTVNALYPDGAAEQDLI